MTLDRSLLTLTKEPWTHGKCAGADMTPEVGKDTHVIGKYGANETYRYDRQMSPTDMIGKYGANETYRYDMTPETWSGVMSYGKHAQTSISFLN